MVARRYRRMPKDFADFEHRFSWRPLHAANLVSPRQDLLDVAPAQQKLMDLARTYRTYFTSHPDKTHVFPLLGTLFQFEFARGVRDAMGLKTRLRTITTDVSLIPPTGLGYPRAKRLGLRETGIVLHDSVGGGRTLNQIANITGIPKQQIVVNELSWGQTVPLAEVPLPGGKKKEAASFKSAPKSALLFSKKDGRLRAPSLTMHGLSPNERNFVKRAVYAAGVAATRELMKEEKRPRGTPSPSAARR